MGDPMGMLPNTWLEAAHLANTCARKFAHLETFEAYQLWKEIKSKLISEITLAKDQEEKREGWFMASFNFSFNSSSWSLQRWFTRGKLLKFGRKI
jgi:hypothetical protein